MSVLFSGKAMASVELASRINVVAFGLPLNERVAIQAARNEAHHA